MARFDGSSRVACAAVSSASIRATTDQVQTRKTAAAQSQAIYYYEVFGGYERYRYAEVAPLTQLSAPYVQANRGVVEWRATAGG